MKNQTVESVCLSIAPGHGVQGQNLVLQECADAVERFEGCFPLQVTIQRFLRRLHTEHRELPPYSPAQPPITDISFHRRLDFVEYLVFFTATHKGQTAMKTAKVMKIFFDNDILGPKIPSRSEDPLKWS